MSDPDIFLANYTYFLIIFIKRYHHLQCHVWNFKMQISHYLVMSQGFYKYSQGQNVIIYILSFFLKSCVFTDNNILSTICCFLRSCNFYKKVSIFYLHLSFLWSHLTCTDLQRIHGMATYLLSYIFTQYLKNVTLIQTLELWVLNFS
jgi:hypothetical protein